MSALVAARVLVIAVGLLWKSYHLVGRPRDRSLQAVVACFALFALATPLQLLPPDARPLGLPPSLVGAAQYVLLMGASLCIMTFFAARRRAPRRRATGLAMLVLAVSVALTVVLALRVPPEVTVRGYADPRLAAMYLVTELYIGLALLVATRDAGLLARSSEVGWFQAVGVGVAALGLALLSAATLLLCVVQLATVAGLGFQPGLAAVGGVGLLVGAPVFIAGICFPGLVMRVRSTTLWIRRYREYQRLEPLWSLLGEAFPAYVLTTGRGRGFPITPSAMGRRHRRRRVEIRDGLLRLGPLVPPDLLPVIDGPVDELTREDLLPLARWMRDHVPRLSEDGSEPSAAARPVLVPAGDDPEDDVLVLVKLSDALRGVVGSREVLLP